MGKPSRIKDIYDYCKDNEIPMLSEYNADFWETYKENYQYFDKLFRNTYKSFVAFSNDESSLEDNVEMWVFDVASWLTANDKRYSELWRMQELSDTDYDPLNNFHIEETYSGTGSENTTTNLGAKTDTKSGSINYGSATKSDSDSYVFGAKSETDSETLEYGVDKTTTETDATIGSQNNTQENTVSAYNSSVYEPNNKVDDSLGSRNDTSEVVETRDSRSDSKSGTHTEASRTDSVSKSSTTNAHTDTTSDTNIYGAQENTKVTSDTDSHTSSRVGNTGVYSSSRLLAEHKELWEAFSFYKIIFDDIANEFLRIVY